jgi:single-strand DNA-binding protein
MSDFVTVTGLIATDPRHVTTREGLAITSFRLASMHRRYDQASHKWIDDGTNWYSVSAFRSLAKNAAQSLSKGQRVIVSGRLKIREWDTGEKSGISVDIEAEGIGHDLLWGTTSYERNQPPASEPPPAGDDQEEGQNRGDSEDDTF